jgi:hypothetical protein
MSKSEKHLHKKWHRIGATVVDVAMLLNALPYLRPKGEFDSFQQKQWTDAERTIPKVCAHALLSLMDDLNDECTAHYPAELLSHAGDETL